MQAVRQSEAGRRNCAERTRQYYDAGAMLLVPMAALLFWIEPSARGNGGGRADLALAIVAGSTMIGSLIAAMRRRRPEGDEYLRRMMGIAAGIGFFATVAVYVVWMPLAPALLPRPSGDRLIAVLLASTAIGWFVAKARHAG